MIPVKGAVIVKSVSPKLALPLLPPVSSMDVGAPVVFILPSAFAFDKAQFEISKTPMKSLI